MQAIVVWASEKTTVPSIIGPYEGDLVWDDANLLSKVCFKVQVCPITASEDSKSLAALSIN